MHGMMDVLPREAELIALTHLVLTSVVRVRPSVTASRAAADHGFLEACRARASRRRVGWPRVQETGRAAAGLAHPRKRTDGRGAGARRAAKERRRPLWFPRVVRLFVRPRGCFSTC